MDPGVHKFGYVQFKLIMSHMYYDITNIMRIFWLDNSVINHVGLHLYGVVIAVRGMMLCIETDDRHESLPPPRWSMG